MKFDCGPTSEERDQHLQQWHKWFAWFPVRVGSHDCRWLEYVERKGTFETDIFDYGWDWEYRALQQKDSE